MAQEDGLLCPDAALGAVVEQLRDDDEGGLAGIARLLGEWPLDPRLHFLKGSVLAGLQRYDEGRAAMARAIEIAPDYALARFQLGFLDLTSGRAIDALGVWQPLTGLPEDEPLRVLAEGLACLASDRFAEARQLLLRGMALNTENPIINTDMQLILDEIEGILRAKGEDPGSAAPDGSGMAAGSRDDAPPSAVDLLLRQQALRDDPKKFGH